MSNCHLCGYVDQILLRDVICTNPHCKRYRRPFSFTLASPIPGASLARDLIFLVIECESTRYSKVAEENLPRFTTDEDEINQHIEENVCNAFDEDPCLERCPANVLVCELPEGHPGPHAWPDHAVWD